MQKQNTSVRLVIRYSIASTFLHVVIVLSFRIRDNSTLFEDMQWQPIWKKGF